MGSGVAAAAGLFFTACPDGLDRNYARDAADDVTQDAAADASTLDASIAFHGETETSNAGPGNTVALDAPDATALGDIVVAGISFGNVAADAGLPSVTVTTAGKWSLLDSTVVQPNKACMFIYWAVNDGAIAWPATWKLGGSEEGVGWLVAYGGVDISGPPTDSLVANNDVTSTSIPGPTLAADPGDVVIVAFSGFANVTTSPTGWALPSPWVTRSAVLADADERRSGILADGTVTATPTTVSVTTSVALPTYVTSGLIALKPR